MKLSRIVLISLFFLYVFSFVFTTSSDFTQDLGRHLKIGEIIVKTKNIPNTNLFSYTNKDFPFINHHWLSEVIFYLTSRIFGLNFLLFLKTVLILVAVGIVFKLAKEKGGLIPAIISGLIFTPFLIERNNIRPEMFGYLFFSIILYLLITYPKNTKIIYLLPLIMVLWINIHISFVFGLFLILFLFLKMFLFLKISKIEHLKSKISFMLLSILVLFLNPHGLNGLLYPFNIFQNYGYTIVENQSIFYLRSMIFNPLLNYFFFILPLLVIVVIVLASINRTIEAFLLVIFSIAVVFQWRHLPFFVLVAIPFTSLALSKLIIKKIKTREIFFLTSLILGLIILGSSIFFISNKYYLIFGNDKKFGLGFSDPGSQGIDFIEKNKLKGNIFNNFDIGGFLIYKLYPQYQFFIDNRPEAYPADFVENVYKKLQVDVDFRKKIFEKYKIKTVIFSFTDQTQWGEAFLRGIFQDPEWRLVSLNKTIVVLTKNDRFKDLRENKSYLVNIIKEEDSYLELLYLSKLFSMMGFDNFSNEAFDKSVVINNDSCSAKRALEQKYLQRIDFYSFKERDLRKNAWYCF